MHEPGALAPLPTVVRFDNQASDSRTVIEIETEDRVGLLHAIAQALSTLALDISVAKICTERGAAFDSFYLCEADGAKLEAPARQQEIEKRLRAAIATLK
jgi:[protein-PII] uridylyltransferase